jgi:cysteine synthase A
MTPTEELLLHLDRTRAALREAVDSIPAVHRERRPSPDRWSVAEVLEHLAIVERRIAGRLADGLNKANSDKASASHGENPGAAASSGPVVDPAQLARFADRRQRFKTSEASEPKSGITAGEAWTALDAVRADVIRLVRESDAFPLADPIAPHPVFGPWTFRQWVVFAGGHDARHADQIREMRPAFQAPALSSSVLRAIGRTPVVRLQKVVPPGAADVLVKLELVNPTGSYKDRMALAMIEGAERRGVLEAGMRVVEFTGGSTGSSLAMVCAVKGYPLVLLSSDAFAEEKLRTMRAFGAELRMVPSEGGKVTPALFERFRQEIAILAAEPGTFWTDQFNNEDALDGYADVGRELLEQTSRVDVFCGAVGTGGMLTGVARALRAGGSSARIVAIEPASSPALTEGRRGAHRVEGIATGRIPPHMQHKPYDEARAIREEDARHLARRLAREEGLLAGTSSALNIAAAIDIAREIGPGKVVATVAVDTGLKYLNGDLFG